MAGLLRYTFWYVMQHFYAIGWPFGRYERTSLK